MTEAHDLAGSDIGRYRVVALLGKGGMGIVYDAIDGSLGRHVALKVLPPEATADPQRLSRFVHEARAASALNHPHVVSIYEIGQDGGHFIALAKVDGITLRHLPAAGRPPPARA